MTEPLDRIIWSADVDGTGALLNALSALPDLRMVKLDRLFLTNADLGLRVIEMVQERGFKVFADAKLIEIPSKLEALAKLHVRYKPWMLNCMAGAVSNGEMDVTPTKTTDGLRRFAAVCLEAEVKPCGVTVLTSKTDAVAQEEYGTSAKDQVLWYVEQLVNAGFTDVVCSPQEIEAIRAYCGDAIAINTPGVRPADSAADDQARTATPAGAVTAGADRLVIGRPITQGDPAENLRSIAASLA